MSRITVYGHYGSHNHGNEAIVRGLRELFHDEQIIVYSYIPETDKKFDLDEVCEIRPFFKGFKRFSLKHIVLALWMRIVRNQYLYYKLCLRPFYSNVKGAYLIEAGDQYCEGDELRDFYADVNKKIKRNGGKTIMLPCTIDKSSFSNPKLISDLKNYSLIFARESITYNSLINAGLGNITHYAPCTAFLMKPKECNLPKLFFERPIVGLTIGLLAQGKELFTKNVIENCRSLIQYLIKNTDYAIALIPHVNVATTLTDIIPLQELYNEFNSSERMVWIGERRADEQKYVISKCRFLVTVRTHASIAAYSSGVPTLVIGYSQKSVGIAMDLFGTSENYVIDVDTLDSNDTLIQSFKWLEDNELEIKQKLSIILPSIKDKVNDMYDKIIEVAGDKSV